jgi:ribosomal protein S18 acetylase RimI-like enzyme
MTITFRHAKPEDYEVCLAFDCTDPTDSRGDEEKSDHIRAKIATKEIYLAVTDQDKPVGYITIDRIWPMMMPLVSWVYVAPAWRNNGIAHKMTEFCFADLKARGYKRVIMSTQTDRELMLKSMREMGLKEIGTIHPNPDETVGEVFFMKDLT